MTYGSDMSFPYYPGADGSPLTGVAYFGVAGQNPVTNPITVYWDSAGTQPASQPVTISNGRTVRSDGTPNRIWVASDYSQLVQDSLGRQVLFEANQPVTIAALNAINQTAASAAAALVSQNAAADSAVTAVNAQTAATLASVTAGAYPNSAATVVPAGVANGQGYWVQSLDGNHLDHYKNVGGVATADTGVNSISTVQGVATIDLRQSPRDAVGLWAIDGYTNAGNPYIPNLANKSLAASSNLKRAPRRAFNSLFYFKSGVTAQDNSVDGLVAGTQDAAILTGTGNWKLCMGTNGGSIPAGTFTLVATIKRHGGVDQPFAFSANNGTTRSAVQTATSAYQRIPYTFAGPTTNFNICLCSSDGVTGASLELESIEIFSGSVDLGRTSDDGNIYLGEAHGNTPAMSNGVMTGAPQGMCSLPVRYGMAKWTVSALINQKSLAAAATILSDINSFNNFAFQGSSNVTTPSGAPVSVNAQGNFFNLVAGQNGQGQRGGFFNLVGAYHLLTITYDGTAEELWLDDERLLRYEHVLAKRSLRDLLLFVDLNSASWHNFAGLLGLWDRKLTDTEVRQFCYYQRVRNTAISMLGVRGNRVLAVEGDSNHAGELASCWPWLFQANDSPENFGSIWASIGSRLDRTTDAFLPTAPALSDRVSYVDAVIPDAPNDRKFILTVGIGTNDLEVYSSTAAFITALKAYCVARANAGWDVCLFTIPPKDGDATHNARRATVNTDIRTNWASYGLKSSSRIIDIASDPIIGPDNSRTANPTYWFDTIHFSDTGNAVVETYARAVINAI